MSALVTIESISKKDLKQFIEKEFYPFEATMGDAKVYLYQVDKDGIWFGTRECSEEKKKYLDDILN